MNDPPGGEAPSSLAAIVAQLRAGEPMSEAEYDRMLLDLIRAAQQSRLPNKVIAATLGVPEWRFKQILKQLTAEVRRAGMTPPEPGSD